MGEYATYRGEQIKMGTCEDMYYLRADQVRLVEHERGNVDVRRADHLSTIRFRFPWPDEDGTEPGAFDPFDRAVGVPGHGLTVPEGVEHYSVQFIAQVGYNVSLPCPEGPAVTHGLTVHRNGFKGTVQIVQQAFRGGVLALICQCGGCGARYNLPTFEDAEPIIVACRAEADKKERGGFGSPVWWHTVADRIRDGYQEAGSFVVLT